MCENKELDDEFSKHVRPSISLLRDGLPTQEEEDVPNDLKTLKKPLDKSKKEDSIDE
jgi:hypothetical protein